MKTIKFEDLNDGYKRAFSQLANALSPENLCGDGEYTRAQAKARQKNIMAEWESLEKAAGGKVEMGELV